VHDDFETIYELMMLVKELVKLFFLVQRVMDIDFGHKFDVDTKFANQIIFAVARNREGIWIIDDFI
jgi:hypothetical protein